MPSTLKQIKTGPEPPSAQKVRAFLSKHVKPEAPYYSNEELIAAIRIPDNTVRKCARTFLIGWFKRCGRNVYWSTPEHIKKL